MKVLIIHSHHLHKDFYNSICAVVGVYNLTGSVSSSGVASATQPQITQSMMP